MLVFAIYQVLGLEDICPNYSIFPKMIGGYNNDTSATYMDYNAAVDLMAVVGYTYDSELCNGLSPSCSFVSVYYGPTLLLKWSKMLPVEIMNLPKLQCSFSADGAYLGVLIFNNMTIALFNTSDGALLAST